jgi:poly(glycerol-phosphate) alpha-glucosyltransferase
MGDPVRRTLLFLGRLHPKKGIRELLIAWARIAKDSPGIARSWRLAIVGWDDAGLLEQLRATTKELGLGEDSVVFPGALFGEDKAAALWNADAFVLPSYSEGLPMAVLEAWAHGLPVFMTRECNLPEGFDAGAAIEIRTDPAELAAVLARALPRPDLAEVGRRGRELVRSQFSWPAIVSELRTVYDWLARGGRPPACVRLD